jgi:magnesium-transporting ATPase (P-type)
MPFAEEEESIWEEILELFREPVILLLIAVMVVYFLLSEHEDALIMLGAIVPIAAIEVLQETRTARAIRALKALVSTTAAVTSWPPMPGSSRPTTSRSTSRP